MLWAQTAYSAPGEQHLALKSPHVGLVYSQPQGNSIVTGQSGVHFCSYF